MPYYTKDQLNAIREKKLINKELKADAKLEREMAIMRINREYARKIKEIDKTLNEFMMSKLVLNTARKYKEEYYENLKREEAPNPPATIPENEPDYDLDPHSMTQLERFEAGMHLPDEKQAYEAYKNGTGPYSGPVP